MNKILFQLLKFFSAILPATVTRRLLPYNTQILQESFRPIRQRIDEYSPRFYENFWKDYPETRDLFGKNMTKKELDARINQFMLFIVENADKPHVYLNFVQHLAGRHKGYGIFSHQFEFVGETNIKTLKEMLGDSFSAADEKEWRVAFSFLTRLMKLAETFKVKEKI